MQHSGPEFPLPPYVSDAWLASLGVTDKSRLIASLRDENLVMRPERLRAIKATPLSFARSLVNKMLDERWDIAAISVDVDENGVGRLIYRIVARQRVFTFVVFSRQSDGTEYTGRIFDSNFDLLGALFEGEVDESRIEKEREELNGKLWHGRTDNQCLGWTLANRSVRFFNHTVECLERGEQPDEAFLKSGGGYIIRNAGWYGNGRFGSRSWKSLPSDYPLAYPYHLDMFPLYLWRSVGFDVAEAMASKRAPGKAAKLTPRLKRWMGVGNSSGIGMIAALVRWPAWMSAYNFPREMALAVVCSETRPLDIAAAQRFCALLERAARYYDEQPDCPIEEIERPRELSVHLSGVVAFARQVLEGERSGERGECENYWERISAYAEDKGSPELSEQVNALILETRPELCAAIAAMVPDAMRLDRSVDPTMKVSALRSIIASRFRWALDIDQAAPGARAHFWYKSEENGENRRGDRGVDAGEDNETFVDVVGAVQELDRRLRGVDPSSSVAAFLVERPELAHAVSRVQLSSRLPYSEIRGNIIGAGFLPMDGIRFLLSTMGLESSHPHSTRWVRGTFLQGAPLPEMVKLSEGRDWSLPALSELGDDVEPAE